MNFILLENLDGLNPVDLEDKAKDLSFDRILKHSLTFTQAPRAISEIMSSLSKASL